MSTAQPETLALVPTSGTIAALVPTTLEGTYQLAQWLSAASFLPAHLRGKPDDTFAIMLAGYELGLPTMAALRGLYIVNGKPSLESRTKAALCITRGVAVYFKRTEYTATRCTWQMKRRDTGEIFESTYTIEEAKAAKLTDKAGPWQSYPKRMLSHRSLGWLCDDACPEVTLGIGTAEDRYDLDDPDVIDAEFREVPASNLQPLPKAEPRKSAAEIEAEKREIESYGKETKPEQTVDELRQGALDTIADLDAKREAAEKSARDAAKTGKPTIDRDAAKTLTEEIYKAPDMTALKAIATRINASEMTQEIRKDLLASYQTKARKLTETPVDGGSK